jgi:hypothetical protein
MRRLEEPLNEIRKLKFLTKTSEQVLARSYIYLRVEKVVDRSSKQIDL